MPTWRNDRTYVAKREALQRAARRNATPCWLCQKPFPWELLDTLGKEAWKHPLSFTADHETPIALGGHMTKQPLRPAHRACNSRRGAKPTATPKRLPRTSRDW